MNKLLHNFWQEEWDKNIKSEDMNFYEGEHFTITHIKKFPSENMRGHKVDLIYIDCNLVNENLEMIARYINEIAPSNLVPQRFPIEPQIF